MADPVEKTTQEAGTEGEGKTNAAESSTAAGGTTDGVDMAEALAEALDKLSKVEKERDNYKQGMLQAKGKVKEETTTADTTATGDSNLTASLLRRVKELEAAAANRSQVSTAPVGSSTESSVKVGDNMLSDAQMAELKKRGWDDKKIARFKENLLKTRS